MNRRPPVLVISKAVVGFLQYKQAEGLSPRTIDSYSSDLKLWLEFQEDVDVNKVSSQNIRQYLIFLLNDYGPRRITGNNHIKLSPKTVHNVWITLCAFFHWVSDEFEIPNVMKSVPGPKYQEPPVEPFSKEEVEALLKACDYCREAQTERRHKFIMRRPSGYRDRALILMLLDTGLRASELCSLLIEDLDMNTGKVTVKDYYLYMKFHEGEQFHHAFHPMCLVFFELDYENIHSPDLCIGFDPANERLRWI